MAEAVKLMLGYGSNKSLNIKCAKWFDLLFLKKKRKTKKNKTNKTILPTETHTQELKKLNARSIAPQQ